METVEMSISAAMGGLLLLRLGDHTSSVGEMSCEGIMLCGVPHSSPFPPYVLCPLVPSHAPEPIDAFAHLYFCSFD